MRKRPKRKYYRLNYKITAPKVRIVDKKGEQVGVFSKKKAIELAKEKKVDLVEVAPKADPPVCKLIDFRKFLYRKKKKKRKIKKGKTELKEIRLRPFIADHDYRTRLRQIKEFLEEGNHVRISIRFYGREHSKKDFGFELINRFLKDLGELAKTHNKPRFKGHTLQVLIYPGKNEQKEAEAEN